MPLNSISKSKAKRYLLSQGDILHDMAMPLLNARRPYDAMVLGGDWKNIHLLDFVEALEAAKRRIEETLSEMYQSTGA